MPEDRISGTALLPVIEISFKPVEGMAHPNTESFFESITII